MEGAEGEVEGLARRRPADRTAGKRLVEKAARGLHHVGAGEKPFERHDRDGDVGVASRIVVDGRAGEGASADREHGVDLLRQESAVVSCAKRQLGRHDEAARFGISARDDAKVGRPAAVGEDEALGEGPRDSALD